MRLAGLERVGIEYSRRPGMNREYMVEIGSPVSQYVSLLSSLDELFRVPIAFARI